jgi:hypothetical protein
MTKYPTLGIKHESTKTNSKDVQGYIRSRCQKREEILVKDFKEEP